MTTKIREALDLMGHLKTICFGTSEQAQAAFEAMKAAKAELSALESERDALRTEAAQKINNLERGLATATRERDELRAALGEAKALLREAARVEETLKAKLAALADQNEGLEDVAREMAERPCEHGNDCRPKVSFMHPCVTCSARMEMEGEPRRDAAWDAAIEAAAGLADEEVMSWGNIGPKTSAAAVAQRIRSLKRKP